MLVTIICYPGDKWTLQHRSGEGWTFHGKISQFNLKEVNDLLRTVGVIADCVGMGEGGKLILENNFQTKFPQYFAVKTIRFSYKLDDGKKRCKSWTATLTAGGYIDDVKRSRGFNFDAYMRDDLSIVFEHLGRLQHEAKKPFKFPQEFNGEANPKPVPPPEIQPVGGNTMTEEEQMGYLEMLLGEV